MSVHYKFKNTIAYEPIKFDGVYISASDLKAIIFQQKKLGNCELQVENEETGEHYTDDQMIPKNTNVIVSRFPIVNSNKRTRLMANQPYPARFSNNANSAGSTSNNHHNNSNHHHNNHHHHHNNHHHHHNNRHSNSISSSIGGPNSSSSLATSGANIGPDGVGGGLEAMELVSTKTMSEEEKLKDIQSQSTKDFDPARYARSGRGGGLGGRGGSRGHFVPGPGYTCRKCGIPGHSIYDCKSSAMTKVKRSSGIPRDFLMKVDSKEKGALMTPSGEYAVPYIDREAYNNPKVEKAPFFEDGTPGEELTYTTKASTTVASTKTVTANDSTTAATNSTATRSREIVTHTK